MTGAKLELIKILSDLGGTILLTVLLIYIVYKLLVRFGIPFIESQQKIAEAMGSQAQCMANMQTTVNDYVCRENTDHREILLSLQVVVGEIKLLKTEVRKSHGNELPEA